MDTLLLIAIVVILLWTLLSAVYLYLGRQQKNLQSDIEAIQAILQDADEN